MTDNEKAATFIGWKPDAKCHIGLATCSHIDQPWFDPETEDSKRWLKVGGEHPPFAEHSISAPDMADPRNYMKAFAAISARGLYVYIHIYKAVGGPHYTGVWIKPEWKEADGEDGPDAIGRAMNADAGVAAIEALAAFYDAESRKPTP